MIADEFAEDRRLVREDLRDRRDATATRLDDRLQGDLLRYDWRDDRLAPVYPSYNLLELYRGANTEGHAKRDLRRYLVRVRDECQLRILHVREVRSNSVTPASSVSRLINRHVKNHCTGRCRR